jgi:PleD family two-component response regulator
MKQLARLASKHAKRELAHAGTLLAAVPRMSDKTVPVNGKELLVAVQDCERLERILAGHRLTIPKSVDEAKARLEAREFALVILGVHFDESRMFELLRLVRVYDRNKLTPVVCMLSGASRMSEVGIEGLDHAVKAMLANAFLNLNKFPDDAEGNARVRRIIDYLILIDGDMHGGFATVHDLERKKAAP